MRTYHAPNPMAARPARTSARRPTSLGEAPLAATAAAAAHADADELERGDGRAQQDAGGEWDRQRPRPAERRDEAHRAERHAAIQRCEPHRAADACGEAEEDSGGLRERRPEQRRGDEERNETDTVGAGDHHERTCTACGDGAGEVAGAERQCGEDSRWDPGRGHRAMLAQAAPSLSGRRFPPDHRPILTDPVLSLPFERGMRGTLA